MATLPQIPLPYLIHFLWFEPAAAFIGALLCHFSPSEFLPAYTDARYTPSNQIIYDMLGATYVLFAWNEAVVLRFCKDLRVWKAIVLGILVCDILHLCASWAAIGTEAFFNPITWRSGEWVNYTMLYGPAAMRIAFLMEVGFSKGVEKGD
ncbi:MAG: hypothetical protein M1821_007414 [Bathelium mastoideum]|nr:MAG: hypothetical protein M1821_007414 [Bathelium mastoideum]